MYREERYDGSGLAERIEIDATTYKRWVRPDWVAPVESRAPSQAELDLLDELDDTEDSNRARQNAALMAALTNVLGAALGNDLVTILVGGGVVPVKAAKSAGWVPPP